MTSKRLIRMSLVLASVLLTLISVLALAEDAPKSAPAKLTPWTPEDILSAEYAFQWKISPDGKWAVWVKSLMDKEKNGRVANLVLTSLETKKEVPLTRGPEDRQAGGSGHD